MGNTALSFPDDAGMIRVDEHSGLGFAIATDCNGRFCQLDPYEGAQARPRRGVPQRRRHRRGARPRSPTASTSAAPRTPRSCGSSRRRSRASPTDASSSASPSPAATSRFYNQTGDQPIFPTPVVGVLGIIDDVARRIPSGWQDPGENIYLLGVTATELSGSAWAGTVHGHLGGRPPAVDLGDEKQLAELLHAASPAVARLERARPVGRRPRAGARRGRHALRRRRARLAHARSWSATEWMPRSALFSESTGRVIVTVPREDDVKFRGLCDGRGYPVLRIGVTDAPGDGDAPALEVQGLFTVPLTELRDLSHVDPARRLRCDGDRAGRHRRR